MGLVVDSLTFPGLSTAVSPCAGACLEGHGFSGGATCEFIQGGVSCTGALLWAGGFSGVSGDRAIRLVFWPTVLPSPVGMVWAGVVGGPEL